MVEAAFEKIEIKHEIFRALDKIVREDAILASNTSAIPITKIAAVTERPERVVGAHFFSPVPMMQLCELVRGYKTSDETLATTRAFAESVGKTCIVVNRDVAGFVTTRLISALVVEAAKLYESGVASAEDIDIACKLGFGHAMGPLATADLTGVDILLHATSNIYTESQDEKFAPPELHAPDGGRRGHRPQERPGLLQALRPGPATSTTVRMPVTPRGELGIGSLTVGNFPAREAVSCSESCRPRTSRTIRTQYRREYTCTSGATTPNSLSGVASTCAARRTPVRSCTPPSTTATATSCSTSPGSTPGTRPASA